MNRLVLGDVGKRSVLGLIPFAGPRSAPLLFPKSPFTGLHRVSLFGTAGCFLAVLLGLGLLRAIGKSGHLDRRE